MTAAWEVITAVPVILHQLENGAAVVEMAQRLERQSAYDAAYLVLADRLGVDLWTLDGPLARNAGSRGLSVARRLPRVIEKRHDSDW